jgi:hypothetical protein
MGFEALAEPKRPNVWRILLAGAMVCLLGSLVAVLGEFHNVSWAMPNRALLIILKERRDAGDRHC